MVCCRWSHWSPNRSIPTPRTGWFTLIEAPSPEAFTPSTQLLNHGYVLLTLLRPHQPSR